MVEDPLRSQTKIPYHIILIFLLLTFVISLPGHYYYLLQKERIKTAQQDELAAVADLKVQQISGWRKERLADARASLENGLIAVEVDRWLRGGKALEGEKIIRGWLVSRIRNFDYSSVLLLDMQGRTLLAESHGRENIGYTGRSAVAETIQRKTVILTDLHRAEPAAEIRLDLVIPLLLPQAGTADCVAVLFMRIDPYKFFYPLIQSWPTPSSTAETLLVRREGNTIVFLNELRHRKNTALALSESVEKADLPAAMVARGQQGIVEGVDYRGVPVIAYIKAVPDSSWFIISKIDREEIYRPLYEQARNIILVIVLMIAVAAAATYLFWRRQEIDVLTSRYESERTRLLLERRYNDLSRYANDIILLMDENWRIAEANDRALEAYGYTRDELLRLGMKELRAPVTRELFEADVKHLIEHDGRIYETLQQHKDSTIFPVEASVRRIEVDGRIFYQGIFRDVTGRKQAAEEILRARDFLENIYNTMPNGIMVTDKQGCVTRVNKAIENMLHIPCEELIGKHTAELSPQDGKHQFIGLKLMTMLRERGSLKAFEAEWLRKDGSLCPVELNITMLHDREGNRIGSVSVVQEITARKQAEAEMKNRITQQSALMRFGQHALVSTSLPDFLHEAVVLVSQTLDVEYCKILELLPDGNNLLLKAGIGWKQGLVGQATVGAATDSQAGFTLLSSAPVIIEDLAAETRFICPPLLREHGVVSGVSVIISLPNRPYGVLGAHSTSRRDFTRDDVSFLQSVATIVAASIERQEAHLKLEESREFLSKIINAIGDPVFVKDREHRMVLVNESMCAVIGRTREDIIGRADYDFFPAEQVKIFWEKDEELLATGMENINAEEITNAQGELRSIITKKTLYTDNEGNKYIVGIIRDVTDSKRAEEDKNKLRNQLYQAQKMEAIGHLSGGIAHDFNNILTAIIGYSNLLQMKMNEDDPLRANVEHILSASERAATLVHSLLAFSKKQNIALKPVNSNDIVASVAKLLQRLIGEDIDLQIALAEQDALVLADAGQIDQVLINLATNARDAMPGGGSLTISTGLADLDDAYIKTHGYGIAGRYVLITVSDSGAGMDEQTREHIFEPFYTTKEVGKGTGLGLSTAYGIMKQHNGYINCYSEQGKGTIFRIYLPVISKTKEILRQAAAAKPRTLIGGPETILLAEDDATIRQLNGNIMRQFGYTVIEAVNGEDAVAKFKEHQGAIQLLLLDVIMPKKNGREVFVEIQKLQPGIKVLFTSGYTADIIHKSDFLDEGLAFLMKPVSMPDLLGKVREVLDK